MGDSPARLAAFMSEAEAISARQLPPKYRPLVGHRVGRPLDSLPPRPENALDAVKLRFGSTRPAGEVIVMGGICGNPQVSLCGGFLSEGLLTNTNGKGRSEGTPEGTLEGTKCPFWISYSALECWRRWTLIAPASRSSRDHRLMVRTSTSSFDASVR